MNAMNSMFFSGQTESQAILAAANHFGVSPEQVVFDRVEKRHGFVKHRRVVIRVDPARVGQSADGDFAESDDRADVVAGPVVEAAVRAVAEPASADDDAMVRGDDDAMASGDDEMALVEAEAPEQASGDVVPIAHAALDQLFDLADLEVSAEIVLAGERLEIEIEGVDEELLVEDEGQVLLALQHLLPRVMYGQLGRIVPCRLDSRGYQQKKEERLRGLARRVAEEVVDRGGTRTLRPMNPADRRIVHLTLADDPDVETESQGNGYFKRVSIRLL
jgi:predicted RNA-binding protein Jag